MSWVRKVVNPLGATTLLAVLVGTTPARSQQESVAESLFREAREDMKRGEPAAACPKFEESHRLDPSIGTLLNLALCEEALGNTATAWTKLRQLLDSAPAWDSRRPLAQEKLTKLEAELPWVRLLLDPGDDRTIVELDDVELRSASLNQALPVNPGEHRVRVERPTGESSEAIFQILPAQKLEFRIWAPPRPAPAVSPGGSAPAPSVAQPALRRAVTPNPNEPPNHRSSERALAYALGVVGVTGLVASGAFALMALHDRNTVHDECPHHDCRNQSGLDAVEFGARNEKLANVAFVAGALVLATGGVVFWHSRRTTAAVSVSPNSALLSIVGFVQ